MKNIFSKTTEKRTQNGLKTDSKRTNYGIPILILAFLTLGVGQMWSAVTLYYQKDMPSKNYSASSSATMTQSSANSNRYYCEVSLENGSYGFYIKNGSDYYKANATASSNRKVQVWNYGSTNYGNSPDRITYSTGAAKTFIFTVDFSNSDDYVVYVSPKSSETVKVAWSVASGHDGDYNLPNYTGAMTQDGANYYVDIDLTAVKHYMFIQISNSIYWRGEPTLTENGSAKSLWDYGTSNYGNSAHKANFTPGAAAKYRFTWNHDDKTIKYQRLYNISYQKGDNGTGSTQTDYKVHGTAITLRSSGDFTRTGYNHTAWNTSSTGSGGTSYAFGATYSTNGNLTLYPTWTAKTTTVTLQGNAPGGTTVTGGGTTVTATYDAALPSFSALTCTGGYALKGYYTNTSGGTKVINADGTFAANSGIWNRTDGATLTLHAQWSLDRTLTYDANGGTGTMTDTNSPYANGATVTVKSNSFTRTGYTFTGWNTAANGSGTPYSAGNTFSISANTTLFAQWSENMTTVNFVASTSGAGTFTVDDTPSQTSTTVGVTTTHDVTAVPYPGYRVMGSNYWTAQNANISLSSRSTNPTTVTGCGTASTSSNLTATFTQTYAYLQGRMTIYTAVARSTKKHIASSEGKWDVSSNRIQMDYDGTNHRFYLHTYMTPKELSTAQTDGEQYFHFKTSTSSSSDDTDAQVYNPSTGRTLTASGTGNKKETGSSDGANNIWFDDNSTTDGYAIIYFDEAGVWYEVEHSLTYDKNSGSGTLPSTTCHLHGTNGTVGSGSSLSKSQFTFSGWNTSQYISGTSYAAGDAITMNANTTLYAKWTRSITLNQNGGGSGSTSVTATYNCATLPTITAPSKTGYTFGGWNTANDGSGDIVINTSGEFLPITGWCDSQKRFTRTASGATLYAKWTQTVTLDANTANHGSGANGSATIVLNATANSGITHCTPATGYQRTGYYTEATGGTKVLNDDGSFAGSNVTDYITSSKWTKAGATTLYAQYEPITYTVTLDPGWGGSGTGSMTVDYDATEYKTFNHTFTQTGYHIDGWYTNDEPNVKVLNNDGAFAGTNITGYITSGKWSKATDCTLYTHWAANTYTVTLELDEDHKGTTAGATTSHTVTFNTATTNIPSLPTAEQGYGLEGYYTDHNGAGTKVINGDGTFIASVDGYTDGNKKWIRADGVTLYAYYKEAQITGITFTPGNIVAPGATVSVTATVEPTPVGPTTICWRVLYSNDNPLDPQPTFTPVSGAIVSFPAHSASGSYKVEATLRKGTGCGGEEIHTFTAPFQVAGDHTVTVQYKCGNTTIAASTTTTGRPLVWSSAIAAPEIFGYTFHHWLAGDGITLSEDGTNAKTGERADSSVVSPIYIKAIYDGKLTAVYTQNNIIYFKNTLGWENVFVNFYTGNAWNNDNNGSGSPKGCGNSGVTHRNKEMTRIGDSDVWYYDYGYNGGGSSITPSLYVSFTGSSRPSVSEFWGANPGINVVYPANYADAIATDKSSENGFKAATPMFVPISQDPVAINVGSGGKANYYNAGYWTTYTPGTGYTLEIYNDAGSLLLKSIEFTSEDDLMPMKAVADLEAGKTYKYQIRRGGTGSAGVYYGNKSTMTYKDHGQTTAWSMTNTMDGGFKMCGITTNAAGDYTFKLSYSGNNSNPVQYRLRMEVDYPIASGDYRVIYTDNTRTGWKESAIITQANNAKDTVSFFIRPGSSPKMNFQQATVNGETGVITWDSIDCVATATLKVLPKDSVYNVCLTMDGSGAISLENIEGYTGNFYIRTDAANSKWDNYRSDPDHLMTYSEYSITHGGYSHYYCHWVTTADAARKNVKFCIANDYSPCISDTLTRETASGEWANINSFIDANGNLLRSANVRFMWNQHDNTIKRAYLDPAKNDDNFLVLASADSKIADKNKTVQTSVVFSDNENWIYEANVKAKPNAQIKLKATWGDATTIVQYFKGTESTTESLITGSGSDWYDIRLIYDYKTNRLIAAMLPSGNHTSVEPINADVMFIREHQGDISQVTFTEDGALTDIKIAYGVMRFNKWTLNNKDKDTHSPLASPASPYERAMYFISFPFEVKLSEVFGIGNYGQDWIVEYYDGAERARTGWWEGEPGFWRYVWNRKDFVLKPNVGYLLQLELASFGEESSAWDNDNERLELFFPSSGNLGTITNTTVNCTIPEHACTINRAATEGLPDTPKNPHTSYNRTIFDSHWNVMSVPTYVNATPNDWSNTTWTTKIGPKFLYTWNPDDNTLTATSGKDFEYHAMHAYMVQYGGNIQWVTSSTSPASIVARDTYAEQPKEIEFRIEIQQNEKMVDQTFVIMSNDDEINANFQFGEDMSKDFNARNANIYTMTADNVAAAGNSLPMSETTTIVPVGVSVKKNGDYTFAIPEGTEGIGVTLVDNETGIRTPLGALDYTVTLQPGDYTGRFVLEISPIAQTPTGVETVTGEGLSVTGVRKVMIDGILYIVKDGKMYDARGARVE